MVSCGAQGCSWEKVTDNRGLNRHRTGCRFFKRSSTLANEKRLQRARNATSANLALGLSGPSSQVSKFSLQMNGLELMTDS
jgi:hypothetical protein